MQSKQGITCPVPVNVTAQHVPLRSTFKTFFELPGTVEMAKAYLSKKVTADLYTDFVDGEFWQTMRLEQNDDQLLVPFVLYFDDFETANPLGSRAGVYKLGAVYACLKCFPPMFNSQLKNLFLALMFHSQDRSQHCNEPIFSCLIDELKFLFKHGIYVMAGDVKYHVRFIMVQILGDNLGLNSLLGYTESFSANHYCRVCRVHKNDVSDLHVEDDTLFRNRENYTNDVLIANVSETGVKGGAVWNELPYFHVTDNCVFDLMHDLLEGNYDMRHIIQCIVNEKKFISLTLLNTRVQAFDYARSESHNKPPVIAGNSAAIEPLGMKAIEMLCLVNNFSLIVGDRIPHGDEVWGFYLLLRQILDLVFCKRISRDELCLLRTLVAEHHYLYINLFKDNLKPKHHFMVHYARSIRILGPLFWLWSMRFESKHSEAKKTAHVVCNFTNICKTLSCKHQLRYCYRLMRNEGLCDHDLVVGTGAVSERIPGSMNEIDVCLNNAGIESQLFCAKWIQFNGTEYRPGQCLLIGVQDDMPVFGSLLSIFVDSVRQVTFVVRDTVCTSFIEHLHAYEIASTFNELRCISPHGLMDHRPLHVHSVSQSDTEKKLVVMLHCAL